jgi:hypothetical protein
MEYRNSSGGVHFGNALVTGIESSHGVELTGTSTGGIVRPAGDDASIRLLVQAKGPSGILALGTSTGGPVTFAGSSLNLGSTHVNITSTRVQIGGGSTTALSAIQRYAISVPAADFVLSSGIVGASTVSTVTVTGLSTGSVLHFTFRNPINALYTVRAHCSTANELKLILGHNGISTLGSGESTNSGTLLEFVF